MCVWCVEAAQVIGLWYVCMVCGGYSGYRAVVRVYGVWRLLRL